MRAASIGLLLLSCVIAGPAQTAGGDVAIGVGGGLDASAYSGEGVFEFGPVLGGFLSWTGSYPRVYRVSAQWTRLRHEVLPCLGPEALSSSESRCDDTEIVNFASVQGGVLWFGGSGGLVTRYAGLSAGAFRTESEEAENPVTWGLVVAPALGLRFRLGRAAVSIESGGEMVIGQDATFAVIPLRVYVEP